MQNYQKEFIEFLVRTRALRFGSFSLKSGRKSPYFFNSGQFDTGSSVERLGYFYASAARELKIEPTLIFGPAYKGIPLCLATAIAYKNHFQIDIPFSFDRKEVKDHGEGGWLVGRVPDSDDNILLVDDVVTDGATKIETINRLKEALHARVTGLDRKEKNAEGGNAISALERSTGVEVRSIITIHDILAYLPGREIDGQVALTPAIQKEIETYLATHGVAE
ncbi:MAG: orotate phosphoribosyltransferase [bacterium]|nr:orotate phosphoribosyltransferase [bacterium]